MKKRINFKRIFFITILSFSTLIVLLAFSFFVLMYTQVKTTCVKAQKEYGKDCIDSLSQLILSDKKSYQERNDAVWALGQLANKRALPALRTLYTGNIPAREPLDTTLSQYELRKAIRWCEQGNGTSWMY